MTFKRNRRTPVSIVNRLPRYLRYLRHLHSRKIDRVSSSQMAQALGTTASQVRQDLSTFGSYGATGYGYKTKELINEIEHIIGIDTTHKIAVVGVGGIGRAVLEHMDFAKNNYIVKAAFDINPDLVGSDINGVEISHFNDMKTILANKDIDICMLTVPEHVAKRVAKEIYNLSIPAIWNFTGANLDLDPEKILIQDVNFWDSLFAVTFYLKEFNL